MKKFFEVLGIVAALCTGIIFTGITASAEISSDIVSVVIDTAWRQNQSVNDAYFDLYSSNGEYLGTQGCEVITNTKSIITFPVPAYAPGSEFVLRMNYGYEALQYYNELISAGGSFTLGTYAYTDENGQTVMNDTFYMTGVPYSPGTMKFLTDYKLINMDLKSCRGIPMAPADLLLDAVGIPWYEQNYDYVGRVISFSHDGTTLVMNMDNNLAFINNSPVSTDTGVKYIDDKFYVPIGFVLSAYNIPATVEDINGNVNINAILPKPAAEEKITGSAQTAGSDISAESFVNNSGVSSRTDYLIWVSKKDYKVYVFLGSKGSWKLCNTFSCAIGKSSSPTITGQFEYYSRESRWTYDNFYVGPIMRFKGGYAIHSTLLAYDGSDYDARVGMKLSHGCVRVRKPDIDWLVAYVPLYTRIYITE